MIKKLEEIKIKFLPIFILITIFTISCSSPVVGAKHTSPPQSAPSEQADQSEQKMLDEQVLKQFAMFSDVFTRIQKEYVGEVENKELFYGAIQGMLNRLDPYSQFYSPEKYEKFQTRNRGTFGGLGIVISIRQNRLTVISPIEDTPAYKAGILAGDHISKIEEESTVNMSLSDAVELLRGKPGTKVTITIVREGVDEPFEVTITRDIIKIQSVKHAIIYDNIGYIRIAQFIKNTEKSVDKAFNEFDQKEVKGIILDLRNNPGGLLSSAVEVASDFLEQDKLVVYTKGRKKREDFQVKSGSTQKEYPLVVLVNQGSASGSEIVAGAIKDHRRGIIMGTPTFGKASVQKIRKLPDGSAIKLTIAHYYTPNGTNIHEVGIRPDIELPQFTSAEIKMFNKLKTNERLDSFLEDEGESVLSELEKAEDNRNYEEPNDLLTKYQGLIDELEEDGIVLSNDLIKYALASKTKSKVDDYEYNRHIQFAAKYLQTLRVMGAE